MITDLDTFTLAAVVKGYMPANDDEEYIDDVAFRLRAWHALDDGEYHDHAVSLLETFGREPDDEMIYKLVAEGMARDMAYAEVLGEEVAN